MLALVCKQEASAGGGPNPTARALMSLQCIRDSCVCPAQCRNNICSKSFEILLRVLLNEVFCRGVVAHICGMLAKVQEQ